jgi:hypothetical protein
METILKDIRYGVRCLLKHPGGTGCKSRAYRSPVAG